MGLFGNDVGIGTTTPGRQFHVLDNSFVSALFQNSHASGSAIELNSVASSTTWEFAVTGTNGIFGLPNGSAYLRKQGNNETGISILPSNNVLFSGYVGIGTTLPARPLQVVDSDLVIASFLGSNAIASVTEFASLASGATWEYSVTGTSGVFGLPNGSAFFHKQGNGFPAIVMTPSNNVGIGTATPAYPLTVVTPGGANTMAIRGESLGSTGYAVLGRGQVAVAGIQSVGGGLAVYAQGDLTCVGTKAFQIDHPHDPENKYLKHYCAEGPEPQNIYNGSVTTDAKGYARVPLPITTKTSIRMRASN
jgi:hypothetical protein